MFYDVYDCDTYWRKQMHWPLIKFNSKALWPVNTAFKIQFMVAIYVYKIPYVCQQKKNISKNDNILFLSSEKYFMRN